MLEEKIIFLSPWSILPLVSKLLSSPSSLSAWFWTFSNEVCISENVLFNTTNPNSSYLNLVSLILLSVSHMIFFSFFSEEKARVNCQKWCSIKPDDSNYHLRKPFNYIPRKRFNKVVLTMICPSRLKEINVPEAYFFPSLFSFSRPSISRSGRSLKLVLVFLQ